MKSESRCIRCSALVHKEFYLYQARQVSVSARAAQVVNQRVYSELRWSAREWWMNLHGPDLWVIRGHFARYWDFDCLAIAASLLSHTRKTQLTAQGGDFRISPARCREMGFRKNYFVLFNYTIRSTSPYALWVI